MIQDYNTDPNIIICVYACATIEKYKLEMIKVNETWGKTAELSNIKVLFFLGEEETELKDDKYIYLQNVKNDYLSASDKQNLGLKYVYDNYSKTIDYVLCCGTDAFVNIVNLKKYLKSIKSKSSESLYIGGHGSIRKLNNKSIYFHSGGPGFILSNGCLKYIYPLLKYMLTIWQKICIENNEPTLIPACDLSISYFLQEHNPYMNTQIITLNECFFGCNYKGKCYNNKYNCCSSKINIEKIISCHNMSVEDFCEYSNYLATTST